MANSIFLFRLASMKIEVKEKISYVQFSTQELVSLAQVGVSTNFSMKSNVLKRYLF